MIFHFWLKYPFYPNFHHEGDPGEQNGVLMLQRPCYELLAYKVSARKLCGLSRSGCAKFGNQVHFWGSKIMFFSKFLQNEKLEPGGCGIKRKRIFRAFKRTQACPARSNRSGEKSKKRHFWVHFGYLLTFDPP